MSGARTPNFYDASIPKSAVEITASDSADLDNFSILFIGTGGDVKVDCVNTGTAVTFKNVEDGTWLPVRVRKVYATDTTASDIVACY